MCLRVCEKCCKGVNRLDNGHLLKIFVVVVDSDNAIYVPLKCLLLQKIFLLCLLDLEEVRTL